MMGVLVLSTGSYLDRAAQANRQAKRQGLEVQATQACEAGVQSVMRALWRPFKTNQTFVDLDSQTSGSSVGSPTVAISDTLADGARFSAGVIAVNTVDSYTRRVTIRCIGWIDTNRDGTADSTEAQKIVDVVATYQLSRSQVFDYTYFVNNYGWMDGFGPNDLIINGDMRSNGNFSFLNGTPTVNGTIVACANDKLSPPATGTITGQAVKWSDATYASNASSNQRIRPAYDSSTMGSKGSTTYEQWRDYIFESDGSIVNSRVDGAVLASSSGSLAWSKTSGGATQTTTVVDTSATKEVIMPDLNDMTYYQNVSTTYVDDKNTYADGTANPNAGQGAWVKVWNGSAYQTISTNGIVSGSAALIGSSTRPILIHGPVTFTQDCVIKGVVSGQGTIYTGRNVHIVGSITYKTPPDFRGSNPTTVNNRNEKADMLALAARGSVIMGNPKNFGYYPLRYMTPPFTKARKDENGNTIPAFDANQVDSTGFKRYQSVMGDNYLDSISSGVNQIDAVLYTNFVGGGNIGTGGGGVVINGSIISRDEAMVCWSLPSVQNYDSRIRESALTQDPLVELNLPRSPVLLRSAWQDRGFYYGSG